MMFLDCPAYLDDDGAERCGLPAEVTRRFTMRSSDGPLEGAMIRCPARHWFNGPIESLILQGARRDQGSAGIAAPPRRDRLTIEQGRPDGREGRVAREGRVIRAFPEKPEQVIPRPAGAPPYYLGRPAWLWISAMSPRRKRTAQAPLDASAPASVRVVRGSRGAALTQAR